MCFIHMESIVCRNIVCFSLKASTLYFITLKLEKESGCKQKILNTFSRSLYFTNLPILSRRTCHDEFFVQHGLSVLSVRQMRQTENSLRILKLNFLIALPHYIKSCFTLLKTKTTECVSIRSILSTSKEDLYVDEGCLRLSKRWESVLSCWMPLMASEFLLYPVLHSVPS